jgi:hypothetical protein
MWSSATVRHPVDAKTGGMSLVLHAGDPNVVMQRPCAQFVDGRVIAPTNSIVIRNSRWLARDMLTLLRKVCRAPV